MPQIRCLITFRVESSIISKDRTITDNITMKMINVYLENCKTKNRPLGNFSINGIFFSRFPVHNNLNPQITEKRRNKAKYLTWNSIKLVKKTSIPNSVESLGYIKCYSSVVPDLLKSLAFLSNTTIRRSAIDREDLKSYWKSEKGYISLGDQQFCYSQVFQRLY